MNNLLAHKDNTPMSKLRCAEKFQGVNVASCKDCCYPWYREQRYRAGRCPWYRAQRHRLAAVRGTGEHRHRVGCCSWRWGTKAQELLAVFDKGANAQGHAAFFGNFAAFCNFFFSDDIHNGKPSQNPAGCAFFSEILQTFESGLAVGGAA